MSGKLSPRRYVHEEESSTHAATLIRDSWREAGCPEGLVLHSDNGGPMKGAPAAQGSALQGNDGHGEPRGL
ncbi:hypothetical protein D7X99_41530 [Corallococcus sp. AB032C]|nr:hypothetical protein D7X99_41530 [Corallococcus sp. AB032C]